MLGIRGEGLVGVAVIVVVVVDVVDLCVGLVLLEDVVAEDPTHT